MNSRVRKSLQSMKAPMKFEKEKRGMQGSKPMDTQKGATTRKSLYRQKKIALQQDVDKLKKKLRHEENVHRALERAFNRPWGALPRLPPYLPPNTLELLAEVAVLEEEVVRLEEQVVHFRQGLYQEAIYVSSSKRNIESFVDLYDLHSVKNSTQKQSKLSPQDYGRGKENQLSGHSPKKKSSTNLQVQTVKTRTRRPSIEQRLPERNYEPQKVECKLAEPVISAITSPSIRNVKINGNESVNGISENILKCLCGIYLRMSSSKSRATADTLPSLASLTLSKATELKDPYNIFSEFGNRDIGPYKNLFAIEATSININRTTSSMFLVRRLKLLLGKLASSNLKGLTHQEKIAFWINIYNSCMMNAFLEHGIPDSPEKVVELMKKASINVGGQLLNAITIEHFILRLPYHSKYTFAKGVRNDEMIAHSAFALELSEPLVTFALSCGSWSSPVVRIYTASQVENELEVAKRDYLQAAVGISNRKKLIGIPKLLDWYLLDFAKDVDSLLDWICLQLPNEIGKEAIKCLDRRKDELISDFVRVIPYEFNFRYLLHP